MFGSHKVCEDAGFKEASIEEACLARAASRKLLYKRLASKRFASRRCRHILIDVYGPNAGLQCLQQSQRSHVCIRKDLELAIRTERQLSIGRVPAHTTSTGPLPSTSTSLPTTQALHTTQAREFTTSLPTIQARPSADRGGVFQGSMLQCFLAWFWSHNLFYAWTKNSLFSKRRKF